MKFRNIKAILGLACLAILLNSRLTAMLSHANLFRKVSYDEYRSARVKGSKDIDFKSVCMKYNPHIIPYGVGDLYLENGNLIGIREKTLGRYPNNFPAILSALIIKAFLSSDSYKHGPAPWSDCCYYTVKTNGEEKFSRYYCKEKFRTKNFKRYIDKKYRKSKTYHNDKRFKPQNYKHRR